MEVIAMRPCSAVDDHRQDRCGSQRLRYRSAIALLGTLLGAAILLAACGSSARTAPSHQAAGPTLEVRTSPYGPILTTGAGYTLYMFSLDTSGHSGCPSGACTALWPPLLVKGHPVVGKGIDPSLVGELTRPGGSHQVTYDGHPLYTYTPDTSPGAITGQDLEQFGGKWYVLAPDGKVITTPGRS